MESTDRLTIKRIIIIFGILICATGFMMHVTTPGLSRSGLAVLVDPHSESFEQLHYSLTPHEYEFKIDLLGNEQSLMGNTTAYVLNASEYSQYHGGTPISDVNALLSVVDATRGNTSFMVTDTLDLYIVFVNTGDSVAMWSYYFAVFPGSYYPTLSIAYIGALITLGGLAWLLTGWKRYFIVGLTINSVLFFLRVFTLTNYSLGLPDIFNDIIHVEFYNDYQYFYLAWIPNLWNGALAYSLEIFNYLYPPLWIYTVGLLGWIPSWLPGLVLFAFNIFTGVLVYGISKELTGNERRSVFAMLLYLFNPLTMFYGSFMWLNPTPFVFFVMLSFYLATKNKRNESVVALGVATLFKQFAVIFFPILVIMFIKQASETHRVKVLTSFLRNTLIYSIIVLGVSLPFLLVSPNEFMRQVFFSNQGNYNNLTYFISDLWMPVHAGTFYLWVGAPLWLTDTIAFLTYNYVFLALSGIVVYGSFSLRNLKDKATEENGAYFKKVFSQAILWSIVAVLCLQAFYPRGVYKFYLLILSPFIALLFDVRNLSFSTESEFKFQKRYLFTFLMSLIVILCYRFVYLWIIVSWILFYLWKSGNLSWMVGGFKRILRRPQPDGDDTPAIKVYDEIYSE
ncbi:MAG: hypothetical protein RTU30_14100 [Candidatus Thorarchaeota archaeon]